VRTITLIRLLDSRLLRMLRFSILRLLGSTRFRVGVSAGGFSVWVAPFGEDVSLFWPAA
jgi:hypothetical protein